MIPKDILEDRVEKGMSTRQISRSLESTSVTAHSLGSVRYWLQKYDLKTKKPPFNKGAATPDKMLKCCKCGKLFNKAHKIYKMELKRNLNHNFHCGKDCAGMTSDDMSPWRKMFSNAKDRSVRTKGGLRRKEQRENNLTIEFLAYLWEKQKGICTLTGYKMLKPAAQKHGGTAHKGLRTASLDRIDSGKGYTKDNVQLLCYFANLGKNKFSHQEVLDFLEPLKGKENKKS